MKFGKAQSVKRVEDQRFVTGSGRYVDDIKLPSMAYMSFVRTPYGHAKVKAIDASAAIAMDGVLMVLTQQDLDDLGYGELPCAATIKNRDGSDMPLTGYPPLARDQVRFVGQPVAAVVADSREAARDGAEAVDVDYEDLPALANIEEAIAPGAPAIYAHIPGNKVFDWAIGDEQATKDAFAQAAHVVRLRVINNRLAPSAMENRAAIGDYDRESGRYTLYAQTQNVAGTRDIFGGLILKTGPDKVRVITPDVGGGFGTKTFPYPEYVCVLAAAKKLERPVKWTGDRAESFLGDAHGRDMISDAALALDPEGRFLGLEVESWANMGAHLSLAGPFIQTAAGGGMVGGPYKIPAIYNRVHGVITNSAPVDAYRGAGRPEATYLTERLVDAAARLLGLDQIEIRRRNLVPADAMPYTTATGLNYDVGEFEGPLNQAVKFADWAGFAQRKAKSQSRGKLRGIGLSYYIEITSFAGRDEWSELSFAEDGKLEAVVGTLATGQGHETAFAQILCDELGVPFEDIRIVQGDSDRVHKGGGTGGSRSLHLGGAAVSAGGQALVEAAKPLAAHMLEADAADLDYRDGAFHAQGSNRSIGLMELGALAADPARLPRDLRETYASGLSAKGHYQGTHPTFPNGCHIAEVEIDPDTGEIALQRYSVVDDFGRLINPMLVEGQVHGGVVQGIGQALMEEAVYEPGSGQLLTGSFMDYGLPRADDLCDIDFANYPTVNPHNPLGVKGCGEAGTIGAKPAFVHAVLDALAEAGITDIDMPTTPQKIWRLLQKARDAA